MEGKGEGKEVRTFLLHKALLPALFSRIALSYRVLAPKLGDGFISYEYVDSLDELPLGYRNHEGPGFYRLEKAGEGFFTYTHPVDSFKKLLRPPRELLMRVRRTDEGLVFEESVEEERTAIFDIRACDLKALQIMDRVHLDVEHPDRAYGKRREKLFIVGVNCSYATATCFCTHMGSGPHMEDSFDLCITELEDAFLLEVGSERGREVIKDLGLKPAEEGHMRAKARIEKRVRAMMEKGVDTQNLREKLYARMDIENYEDVGRRCLACTGCTQVCPTCFCFDILEENRIGGEESCRVRVWDSCFNPSFATVHRFNIRESIASRYRQWLMHKFAYWVDQMGCMGCVGCGRCITWCPAKIDIREEVRRLSHG